VEEAHQAVILLNGRRVGRKFIKVSFKKAQTPQQQQQASAAQQHMQQAIAQQHAPQHHHHHHHHHNHHHNNQQTHHHSQHQQHSMHHQQQQSNLHAQQHPSSHQFSQPHLGHPAFNSQYLDSRHLQQQQQNDLTQLGGLNGSGYGGESKQRMSSELS